MFVARGIVVCLAFFAVMYGTLSLAIAVAWWSLQRRRQREPMSSAGLLFGLRIVPFAISVLVAVFLTFPSFWLMERRSLDEDAMTFVLAGCAFVLLSVGVSRAFRARARTIRAVTHWQAKSLAGNDTGDASLSAVKGAPALMLVGVCRPKVMFSDMAAAVLSDNELQVAIRHEVGHKHSWDNLKKLLINATPFPGMSGIENAWREAAELAADNAAVRSRQDAIDLATALIKLSRSAKRWAEPELASGLACDSSAISLRVQRLLEWRTGGRKLQKAWLWTLLSLFVAAVIVSNYSTALVLTHRLTELLVP